MEISIDKVIELCKRFEVKIYGKKPSLFSKRVVIPIEELNSNYLSPCCKKLYSDSSCNSEFLLYEDISTQEEDIEKIAEELNRLYKQKALEEHE